MKETPNQKWVRLITNRLNRFKNSMLLISNLSDSRYDSTEEEIMHYFSQIKDKISLVKKEFINAQNRKSSLVLEDIKPWPKEYYSHMNERFHTLMTIRMNRIVKILRLFVNLTNRSHYHFYSYEVKQVFEYIDNIVDITLSHFIGIGDFSFIDYEEEQDYLRTKRS